MKDKIGFKDLKWYLKVLVSLGLFNIVYYLLIFIVGFLIGFAGALEWTHKITLKFQTKESIFHIFLDLGLSLWRLSQRLLIIIWKEVLYK